MLRALSWWRRQSLRRRGTSLTPE